MFLRFDLYWRNRLHLEPLDLDVLRSLPRGAGLILAANHADETDFKACLELSRRAGRRFLFMMNREAFDEGHGLAGWWLQRLGAFSVERGGLRNEEAKRYAIEVVMRDREVLVIFPEGEIYYLNDLVQPFKSGAVDVGMQAVVEARRTRPDWTAYLVPVALKYRYREPITPILERRTRLMEQRLNIRIAGLSLQRRLARIMADLLRRQELAHRLPAADRLTELGERVHEVRMAILSQAEAGRFSAWSTSRKSRHRSPTKGRRAETRSPSSTTTLALRSVGRAWPSTFALPSATGTRSVAQAPTRSARPRCSVRGTTVRTPCRTP